MTTVMVVGVVPSREEGSLPRHLGRHSARLGTLPRNDGLADVSHSFAQSGLPDIQPDVHENSSDRISRSSARRVLGYCIVGVPTEVPVSKRVRRTI